MEDKQFYLEPEKADAAGGPDRYPVSDLPCLVGRATECGVCIDFDRISRRHARFDRVDGELLLVDLDSTNGTFVNHRRIDEATPVQPGDSIHFADHGFVLQQRLPSGATLPHQQAAGRTAGDTIIGFTALPTGFPVQAPEFFELLNDGLVTGLSESIQTAGGSPFGHSLRARSTHPRLAADAGTLFRLASDLGEEARLAQLVRETCLAQAAAAGLQSNLFIEVHPVECEDDDLLIDELVGLAGRFRQLALVCDFPVTALARADRLAEVRSKLGRRDIEICGTGIPAKQLDLLAGSARHLDYLRLPAAAGLDAIAAAARAVDGKARILVDGIGDSQAVASLSDAGANLFQGPGIAKPEPIGAQ